MKTLERDGLLLLLATASGAADGWSYFGMGHAFVANMTGNTVMLGISIFHRGADTLHPLISLAGYIVGTAVGTLLNRRIRAGTVWARSVSWTLLLEAALMMLAEFAWAASRQQPDSRLQLILLSMVAVAIGLQSGAMVQLRIPGVVTTYITGTWTTLVGGVSLLGAGMPGEARDKARAEARFELQGAVLALYLAAAVLTGWAFRHASAMVGAIPSCAVLTTAAYGALRTEN